MTQTQHEYQLELVVARLENQIAALIDTQAKIDELVQNHNIIPRKLSDWHEISLSMVFTNSVLFRNFYEKHNGKIPQEQMEKVIAES